MSLRTWPCISLESGETHHTEAEHWLNALEAAPVACFVVLSYPMNEPSKRFMACVAENDVFDIPGGWWSDTAEKAAGAIRRHYHQIREHQQSREVQP